MQSGREFLRLNREASRSDPTESWDKVAAAAVELASESLPDLRVAEVSTLDLQLEDGKVRAYRAKVKVPSSTRVASEPVGE